MTRLEELFLRWEEQTITPPELDELVTLLARPEARRQWVEALHTNSTLREALLQASQEASGRKPVRPGSSSRLIPAARPRRADRPSPWLLRAGMAAALLLALGVGWLLGSRRSPVADPPPGGTGPAPHAAASSPPSEGAGPAKRTGENREGLPDNTAAGSEKELPAPRQAVPPTKSVEPVPPAERTSVKPHEPPAPPGPEPSPPVVEPPPVTIAAIASLERVQGNVYLRTGADEALVGEGKEVRSGQGLRTIGPRSSAVLKYPDGTRVEVGVNTTLGAVSEDPGRAAGKRIDVVQGIVWADVAKQPLQRPMMFTTPQGRAQVLGTQLTVFVRSDVTRLDVAEGRVRITRAADEATVDVASDHYAVVAAGISLQARPQDGNPPHPLVDPNKVDEAIKKGVAYLRTQLSTLDDAKAGALCAHELVLWTLVHADVPEEDADFQRLFKVMMAAPLQRTYCVTLQAMVLEEIGRRRYQNRLWQCAQFLLDNQCKNGQWSYGEPTAFSMDIPSIPSTNPKQNVASGAKSASPPGALPVRVKEPVGPKRPVLKRKSGPASGDNSNTQYAVLGLRACHDAGIVFPKEAIHLGLQWWRTGRPHIEKVPNANPYAGGARQGWCYTGDDKSCDPYGSMTAGAVGSLCILDYMLNEKQSWKKDPAVLAGLEWMNQNWTLTTNMARTVRPYYYYYYYLYSVERAAILYGTPKIGGHDWYAEGANMILDAQGRDGSWQAKEEANRLRDTCFAILFLKRATKPLQDVASVDRLIQK